MYSQFEKLLKERGETAYKVSKETGISQPTLSDWKNGKSVPKADKLQKIADYFNVSMDYLVNGKEIERKDPELSPKDEKDISKRLQETLDQLECSQDALMFDGEILDEHTKELLKASLENSIRIAKINAKKKFTPKKYR